MERLLLMNRLSPEQKARHDKAYNAFKASHEAWQQTMIRTDKARVDQHLETHQRFDPKGRAILAAEKEREQ